MLFSVTPSNSWWTSPILGISMVPKRTTGSGAYGLAGTSTGRPSGGAGGAVTRAVAVVGGDAVTAGLSAAGAGATSGRGSTRTATARAKMATLTSERVRDERT